MMGRLIVALALFGAGILPASLAASLGGRQAFGRGADPAASNSQRLQEDAASAAGTEAPLPMAKVAAVGESDDDSDAAADDDEANDPGDAPAAEAKSDEDKPSSADAKKDSDSNKDDDSKKDKSPKKEEEPKKDSDKTAEEKAKSTDEKSKSDGKEGEKDKDKAKPSAKEDKDKPAEKKKPETLKVEKKDLKIEVESDGVFVADDAEEVALRPDEWSSFKVLEAVSHGSRVHKGDALVKFDDKDIDEALAQKTLEGRVGELSLMAAEEEFPRLEKSIDLNYDSAKRDYDRVTDELERFHKTMRPLSEKMAGYYLKSAQQELDNAREELNQLEKMYKADEVTEETEEIVLKRQKFQVEVAEFYLEYSKINHDFTMNISIPRRDVDLTAAVDEAKVAFERAKTAKSLGVNKERYELETLRESRARNVEKTAKLTADRALMTLRAPTDGIAYYGRCVNGRWVDVSTLETKLIPFGAIPPGTVVMTIVKDRPLHVETSVGEKDYPTLKEGQAVSISPQADAEVDLAGKVKSVEDVPRGGNQFSLELKLGSDDLPDWLMPGMTCKTKITTYEAKDAVVIPADLVQTDEDRPKVKYVMLQQEDEEKPVRRDIKLGKHKGKDVEVVKGLKAGDEIVKDAKDSKGSKDENKGKDEKSAGEKDKKE